MSGNQNSTKLIEILNYFDNIMNRETINTANYLEWNTFRVFENMESYNVIQPNFKMDSYGNPIGNAKSGVEDALIEFENFSILIECSLRTGASQLDFEADSVVRHLKTYLTNNNDKKAFTLFIAPSIDLEFTMMISKNKTTCPVLPLTIEQFKKLVSTVSNLDYPNSLHSIIKDLIRLDLDHRSAEEWLTYINLQL